MTLVAVLKLSLDSLIIAITNQTMIAAILRPLDFMRHLLNILTGRFKDEVPRLNNRKKEAEDVWHSRLLDWLAEVAR